MRAKLGCHCLGLPTCFGISQRHLCQPLAAELILDGAIFTQDAWETNLGLHGEGQLSPSVPGECGSGDKLRGCSEQQWGT